MFTEQRLAEFLPCAMCHGMPGDMNINKDSWSLRLLTRPCMIWPLYFSSSLASPFAISLQPNPPSSHPILKPPNDVYILQLLQTLFVLSSTFLTRPLLGFYLSFIQVRPQFILLEVSWRCLITCVRCFSCIIVIICSIFPIKALWKLLFNCLFHTRF